MECTVTGDSDVNIVWRKVGESDVLKGTSNDYSTEEYSRKSMYTIESPSDTDDGTYSCESSSNAEVKNTVKVDFYGMKRYYSS